jgi:ketosteroid isomerase-like protein
MSKTSRDLLVMLVWGAPYLLLSGCVATSDRPSTAPASLERDVRAFEAEVFASYNGGDAARAARHYAADAYVFIPNQPPAQGRDAVAANIARYMEDPNFRLDYVNQSTEVSASSDLAYTRGRLSVTYTDSQANSARTVNSNYLLVMRRQPGSGWQVIDDISF